MDATELIRPTLTIQERISLKRESETKWSAIVEDLHLDDPKLQPRLGISHCTYCTIYFDDVRPVSCGECPLKYPYLCDLGSGQAYKTVFAFYKIYLWENYARAVFLQKKREASFAAAAILLAIRDDIGCEERALFASVANVVEPSLPDGHSHWHSTDQPPPVVKALVDAFVAAVTPAPKVVSPPTGFVSQDVEKLRSQNQQLTSRVCDLELQLVESKDTIRRLRTELWEEQQQRQRLLREVDSYRLANPNHHS